MSDSSPAQLSQLAISAALSGSWEEAKRINQEILALLPTNIEALNRLGRAHFELGNFKEAKKNFNLTLDNDAYNQIALKFLKKIEAFSKNGTKQKPCSEANYQPISSDIFLEEPGKTKVVSLLKVAEPHRLSLLSPCATVNLVIKNRGISVTTIDNQYLGVLPDDLSHHLIRLMNGGNKYQAYVKAAKINGLTILIRETYRSARFKNQPSFLEGINTILTYSSDHIIVPDDSEDETVSDESEEENI